MRLPFDGLRTCDELRLGTLATVGLSPGRSSAVPPLPDDVEGVVAAGAERIAAGAAPVVMPCSPLTHTDGLGNSVAVQLAGGRAVTLPGRSLDRFCSHSSSPNCGFRPSL